MATLREIAKGCLYEDDGYESDCVYYIVIWKPDKARKGTIYYQIEYDPYMDTSTISEFSKGFEDKADNE